MKKLAAWLLFGCLLVSMAGCGQTQDVQPPVETTEAPVTGYMVPSPMTERPSYQVSENPTTQELRETAVRAMHEMLSIQWSTDQVINYNKNGAVSNKDYHYDPQTTYCGLPYADGQTNIYVWLEYYDYRSGQFRMEGDGQWLNKYLGNTCAGSLMWAWSTVCDSLTGKFVNTEMTPLYGCLPVGDYTYSAMPYLTTYKSYSTDQICTENGQDVMFACYAQMKMADAITSSTTEHTMMSIIDAVVVRDQDGKINPLESYIMVQDQAAGKGAGFYEYEEEGHTYRYTGRTGPIALKCTFQWMYEKRYIPVTTAEFLGKESYAKAEISFTSPSCASVEELLKGGLVSNYPMCLMKINAVDENGNKTNLHTVYFNRNDVADGIARNLKFSTYTAMINGGLRTLPAGNYTIEVEATASTGEVFYPVTIAYSK